MLYRASSKFGVSLAILCGVMLVLFSQSSVLANGGPPPKVPTISPSVSCSGTGCNGKDPYSTGCAATGYVQTGYPLDLSQGQNANTKYDKAYIPHVGEVIFGWVQNYYSTTCKTNWAVVTDNVETDITASIEGQNSRIYWWSHCNLGSCPYNSSTQAYWWRSPMYYAPTEPTAAYGNLGGHENCLLQANNGICDHP